MINHSIFFEFKDVLEKITKGSFFFSYKGVLFPMYLDYKKSKKWVIFTPGRHSRSNKKTIPAFQRQYFSPDIKANVISLFDPSLFVSKDLALAWFVGNTEKHYAEILAALLRNIYSELNVNTSNVIIYGTSGGGFPAIKIGTYLKNSTVYCSNIQTDISLYMPQHFKEMCKDVFLTDNIDLIYKTYRDRLNCYEWNGFFNLIVAQNLHDEFHYTNHFLPYYRHLKTNKTDIKYTFLTYEDEESGHAVLSKDIELNIIDSLLNCSNPKKLEQHLPNCKNLKIKKIQVHTILRNNTISATISTSLTSKKLQYAFYLMYANEKIDQRWYEQDNTVQFTVDLNKEISKYFIIGFIRDKEGNKYQEKSYVTESS